MGGVAPLLPVGGRWSDPLDNDVCSFPLLSALREGQPVAPKRPAPARQGLPPQGRPRPPADPAPPAAEKPDKPKLVITDKTEVQLDGQACKLADVPGTASVVSLEVSADKKTILKIHFQSQK